MLLILYKQVPILSLFFHVKDHFQSRAFPRSATVYSLHVLLFGELFKMHVVYFTTYTKESESFTQDCVLMFAEGPAGTLI